jgi:hypothetical protein
LFLGNEKRRVSLREGGQTLARRSADALLFGVRSLVIFSPLGDGIEEFQL